MDDRDRRTFLSTAGGVLAAGLVAGCGSTDRPTTPNEPDRVGDTAAIRGVEITFHDYAVQSSVTYVPRQSDDVTVAEKAGDRETETVEAGSDAQFLLLFVEIANVADDPRSVPIPGGTTAADGEVYLEVDRTRTPPVPVDPTVEGAVGGAFQFDGEWIDRLTLAVGQHQGELPANTSVTGWLLYDVPADFDPADAVLFATANPSGSNNTYRWPLVSE
jgi:hypothetical protein